jgi:hypothetical protein
MGGFLSMTWLVTITGADLVIGAIVVGVLAVVMAVLGMALHRKRDALIRRARWVDRLDKVLHSRNWDE